MPTLEIFTLPITRDLQPKPGARQTIYAARIHPGLQVIASSTGRSAVAVQYQAECKTVRLKLLGVR